MRNLRPFLLLTLTLIMFSCQDRLDLTTDKLLTEAFTKNEINSLESMVDYVDKMVLAKTNEADINEAYHQFFELMSQMIKDSSKFLVPFSEKDKYDFLEKMDTTAYNDIWRISTNVKMVKFQDTIYRDLENFKALKLRPVGNYMDYLKKLGDTDEFFKSLHESIEVAGDLPASIAVYFPDNHNKFDFNIPKNRLWATIYILRIEEPVDMKMERYLNK
ncbi:MAG: hypothetical protein AB7U05_05310 [Mangrovibacterium sp.]